MKNFKLFILAGYSVGRQKRLDHFVELSSWDIKTLSKQKSHRMEEETQIHASEDDHIAEQTSEADSVSLCPDSF